MYNYNTKKTKGQDLLQELQKRKIQQQQYARLLINAAKNISHIAAATADSIAKCGSYISINDKGQITGANFCHNRYCPICQWRASRKMLGQLAHMQDIVTEDTSNFALITLTIRNTDSLQNGLYTIYDGLHRYINDRRIKKSIIGYMRTLEITYNTASLTWHPHIHLIAALHPDYYDTLQDYYITQSNLQDLWRRCIRADYYTQVDIRAIKDGDTLGALAEVAKYAIKPSSVLNAAAKQDTITELMRATYHRRLRSFGGVYRKAAKTLKVKPEDMQDELASPSDTDKQYVYTGGKYVLIDNVPQNVIQDTIIKPFFYDTPQQTCNCCKEMGGAADAG